MRLRYALFCLLLSAAPLGAGEIVFYRCTDAAGALTLQNMPCPKGVTQEKKVMQPVSTIPMGAAATSPAVEPGPRTADAAAAATPADPPTAADTPASGHATLPPPNLYQCTTHDKDTYITESDQPQSRCVALRTVGLDGNPDTGAGQACEVIRDTCARVPDAELCDAWRKRLGETEVAWRFARPGNAAANEAEHLRVQRILAETACAAELDS